MARRLLLLLLAATALASHHHESEWCNAKRHACERACNGDDAVFRCDDAGGARSWSCACDGVRFGGSELKEAVAMVPEAAWVSAPNAALPDAPLPIDRAPLHIDRWFGDEQQDLEQADEVAACLLFAAPFAAAGLAAMHEAGVGAPGFVPLVWSLGRQMMTRLGNSPFASNSFNSRRKKSARY